MMADTCAHLNDPSIEWQVCWHRVPVQGCHCAQQWPTLLHGPIQLVNPHAAAWRGLICHNIPNNTTKSTNRFHGAITTLFVPNP